MTTCYNDILNVISLFSGVRVNENNEIINFICDRCQKKISSSDLNFYKKFLEVHQICRNCENTIIYHNKIKETFDKYGVIQTFESGNLRTRYTYYNLFYENRYGDFIPFDNKCDKIQIIEDFQLHNGLYLMISCKIFKMDGKIVRHTINKIKPSLAFPSTEMVTYYEYEKDLIIKAKFLFDDFLQNVSFIDINSNKVKYIYHYNCDIGGMCDDDNVCGGDNISCRKKFLYTLDAIKCKKHGVNKVEIFNDVGELIQVDNYKKNSSNNYKLLYESIFYKKNKKNLVHTYNLCPKTGKKILSKIYRYVENITYSYSFNPYKSNRLNEKITSYYHSNIHNQVNIYLINNGESLLNWKNLCTKNNLQSIGYYNCFGNIIKEIDYNLKNYILHFYDKNNSKLIEKKKYNFNNILINSIFYSSPRFSKYMNINNFEESMLIDCLNSENRWYAADVLDVDKSNNRIRVHFHGWGKKYREWIIIPSDRIAPHKFYGEFNKKTGEHQKRETNYKNYLNYEPITNYITTSLRKPNLSYCDVVKK